MLTFFLSSCTPAPQEPARVESLSSTSVIISTGATTENLKTETMTGATTDTPKSEAMTGVSETSLPDYLRHALTGTGLEFVKVLDDNSVYTRYQISYLSDGLRISGIMNIPKGDGEYPLVILNHGYIDPAIYTLGRGLRREQDYLARRGFAVLHTDYRNHAFSDDDPELADGRSISRSTRYGSDSINAIYAVREAVKSGMQELANVDPERVGMLGHSMGGGVTMYSLVTHPDLVDAAVLYAPVHSNEYYNFQKWMRPRLSKAEYANLEKEIGDLSASGTFLPISPEGYLSRIQTPIQMYWGTADDSCPIEWARYMDPTFRAAGVDFEYIEYPGEGHEFSREWSSFMEGVVKFYKEEL